MSPDRLQRTAASKGANRLPHPENVDGLTESLSNLDLRAANQYQAIAESTSSQSENDTSPSPSPAKLPIVYTRRELLRLSQSPLVATPPGMPLLKDWFGDWTELQQPSSRKDADGHARERRPRKDADDPEAGSKPSFRSVVGSTQPSQMGNFKHQSLRVPTVSDRLDRERDTERDRESNERLRNLSEKYDRDRLALASSTSFRPQRDKDSVSSGRLSTTQTTVGKNEKKDREATTLRGERDGGRKKAEANDDWRRAPRDEARGRQDRSRDSRDADRDVSWDRAWESDHPDSSRRLLDVEDDRQSRDHISSLRGEENRRDQRSRRAQEHKDSDRNGRRAAHLDLNGDDRSWKDDGRWEERKALREGKERDKNGRDGTREQAGEHSKRSGGRGRRVVSVDEDQNEPAWMATYDPTADGNLTGILGGNLEDGQLDDIQAWKKGIKEKELRERDTLKESQTDGDRNGLPSTGSSEITTLPPVSKLNELDEISMFKMLMKREQGNPEVTISQDEFIRPGRSISLSDTGSSSMSSVPQVEVDKHHKPTPNQFSAVESQHSPLDLSEDVASDFLTQMPSKNPTFHGIHTLSTGPDPAMPFNTATNAATTSLNPSDRDYDVPRQSRFLSYAPQTLANPTTPWQRGQEAFHDAHISPAQINPANVNKPRQDSDISTSRASSQNARASPVDLHRFTSGGATPGDLHSDSRASPAFSASNELQAPSSANSAAIRGSRFAKFFDPKPKNQTGPAQTPNYMQNPNSQVPLEPHSMASMQRGQQTDMNRFISGQGTPPMQDIDGLLNMLHNSSRSILSTDPVSRNPQQQNMMLYGEGSNRNTPRDVVMPEQSFAPIPRVNHSGTFSHNPELDSRFSPDGMVPGLRPIRNRDSSGGFSNAFVEPQLDQAEYFSRGLPHQSPFDQPLPRNSHTALRPSTPEAARHNIYQSNGYSSLTGRPQVQQVQQQHPPHANQRLPPGLANLGGRPPHDPALSLNATQLSLHHEHPNSSRFPLQVQHQRPHFPPNMSGVGVQSHLAEFGLHGGGPRQNTTGAMLPLGSRPALQHTHLPAQQQQLQLQHLHQFAQARNMNNVSLLPHHQQSEYGMIPQEMEGQPDLMSLLLNGHNPIRPS